MEAKAALNHARDNPLNLTEPLLYHRQRIPQFLPLSLLDSADSAPYIYDFWQLVSTQSTDLQGLKRPA